MTANQPYLLQTKRLAANMRYFGSKATTVPRLLEYVTQHAPRGIFCDPFGGMGVVGSAFKAHGFTVVSGDILQAPHMFQVAKLQLSRAPSFTALRRVHGISGVEGVSSHLNSLPPADGWFVEEYARRRLFFSRENAARVNACWLVIAHWRAEGIISAAEHSFLTASLISSMDAVANTAGTYYAHLKSLYRKALKPFVFTAIRPVRGGVGCRALLGEAEHIVQRTRCDVLYLDPPYNTRSYATYYHLPETIARYDCPQVAGRSGMPVRPHTRSQFNSTRTAETALECVLNAARCRVLVLHYSDDGIIAPARIRRMLSRWQHVEEHALESRGYTTEHRCRRIDHRLFIARHA